MSAEPTIFGYRNRAEAIRVIRATTLDPGTRRLLLDVAEDYEQVAEILERIEQVQRVIGKRLPA